MKRKRYQDASRVGRSKIVPFIRGEQAMDRHARRLRVANKMESDARLRLSTIGLSLYISNSGHHWRMMRDDLGKRGFFAEWWPSSAKLVIESRWAHGIHVHDVNQMLDVVMAAAPIAQGNGDAEDKP